MIKLQSDFTTPEQSKRLLELGVPIDSANCYLTRFGIDKDWEVKVLNNVKYSEIPISNQEYCLPCWSVGRLIEIHRICSTLPDERYMFPFWKDQEDNVEWVIRVLESGIMIGNIDFSKLEE